MQWEFSPEDVVKGDADYTLEDFRADLAREVELNMPGSDAHGRDATYAALYDLCYWLATGNALEGFLAGRAFDPPTCDFLRGVAPLIAPNVEMLGAILQRMIVIRVEAGAALEGALRDVADQHRRIVGSGMPDVKAVSA